MIDLQELILDIDIKPLPRLMLSLRKTEVTLIDLISPDPAEIARKCPLLADSRAKKEASATIAKISEY